MYKDFIAALNERYQCSDKSELDGISLQHYTFASTSNGRALNTIGVFEAYGFSMSGLRVLDVGCAYGGFSIEAARKGALCYGIDIAPYLLELAQLNNKDEVYEEGSCKFMLTDATSPDFLQKLPHDFFDLIIVNDVFEHVYDTVKLLSNLEKVANDKCTIYFRIPNGNNLRYVAREPHTGQCGLTLFHPLLWHNLITNDQNIYYRQYAYYLAMFHYFGFSEINLTDYPGHVEMSEAKEKLLSEYEITKRAIKEDSKGLPDSYTKKLQIAMEEFDCQLQYDFAHLDGPSLIWKYDTRFWSGFAQRKPLNLKPPCQTSARRFNSDDICKEKQFLLSREGRKLSIVTTLDTAEEDTYFKFLLMGRRGEVVEESPYQLEKAYTWELKTPGLYWVKIHVDKKEWNEGRRRILTQPLYFPGE